MQAIIQTDLVEVGFRLRGVDEKQVDALVASIADIGLLNPITVYPRRVIRDGNSIDGYGLVAGLHRLTAVRKLGLADIAVNIVTLSELERQIAECDENLCGPSLTASDRARFTARRKEAYEALHPETRHGGDRKGDQVDRLSTRSFADDQSEKTGLDPRTVRRDADRGSKVCDEALDLIRGTKLDTGTYLDKLKALPADEQVKKVKIDVANSNKTSTPVVKLADDPLNDELSLERQVAALMTAWNKAAPEARQEFLDRIDRPVFDRGRAA